jgi:hypothetical protein
MNGVSTWNKVHVLSKITRPDSDLYERTKTKSGIALFQPSNEDADHRPRAMITLVATR